MTSKSWGELFKEHGSGSSDDLIPVGTYDAEVESVEPARAQSGREMLKTRFVITSGPYARRKLFRNIVISEDNPTAMGIFFRHMRGLGLDGTFFSRNPSIQDIAKAMDGRACRVVVKHDTYNGESRADVSNVLPASLVNGAQAGAPPVPAAAPVPSSVARSVAPPASPF